MFRAKIGKATENKILMKNVEMGLIDYRRHKKDKKTERGRQAEISE